MKKEVLIEGILFSVFGVGGIIESLYLIRNQGTLFHEDKFGPGGFLIMVSVALVIIGALHMRHAMSRAPGGASKVEKKEGGGETSQVFRIMGVLILYGLLMELVGYLFATIVFFILLLRILGFRWFPTFALTAAFSFAVWLIFVRIFNMVFPEGILFT